MWFPVRIWGENIFSFSKIDYDVKRGVTTTIVGVNKDDNSQGGNGSGKSALIEVIAIATTSLPLRKVNIDEVISDSAQDAIVGIEYKQTGTNLRLVVERSFSRKDASKATASIYDGKELKETSTTGIDACNDFVVNALGISRDEIFSNFILSKYKYKNFLSVSDNDKKAIINRFSNGILVDQAIEALNSGKEEVVAKFRDAEISFHSSKAKCEAIESQIAENESLREDKIAKNKEQIEEKKSSLIEQRRLARETKSQIKNSETDIKDKNNLLVELDDLDNNTSELSAKETVAAIELFWKDKLGKETTEYSEMIESMYSEFESSCDEIVSIEAELSELENDSKASDEKIVKFDKDYRELIKQRDAKSEEIKGIITQSNKSILEISNLCNEARNEIAALNKRSREIQNILSGVITCPKCSHKFLLDDNADIDGITVEKKLNFENVAIKSDEIVKLEANADVERGAIKSLRQQEASLMDIGKDVAALGRNEADKQNKILSSISKLKKSLSIISSTRDAFENKISKFVTDAFDETEDEIAQMIKVAEKNKMAIEKDLNSIEMRIEQIEFAIEALEKFDPDSTLPELKKRLEQYSIEMSAFDKRMIQIQAYIDKFAMQENVFNEFKTHLANSKIDALSEVTNSFLDLIGSDLRVEFQGFKLLKSGKIRDKITVQLLRNGIEVGSFGKLSVGESARINLACILAMNKLINVNCDDNKGLDLLVLDEILEGIDEAGLVSVLSALNSIGITAIVVSQLAVAESNDNVLIVTKENGESRID